MLVAGMVEGESIGGPVDMGVEAVEPRLTQDDVKPGEWSDVELIVVGIGVDGEGKVGVEAGTILGRTVGEGDGVGGGLGGGGEGEGSHGTNEVAIGTRVDENLDGG